MTIGPWFLIMWKQKVAKALAAAKASLERVEKSRINSESEQVLHHEVDAAISRPLQTNKTVPQDTCQPLSKQALLENCIQLREEPTS